VESATIALREDFPESILLSLKEPPAWPFGGNAKTKICGSRETTLLLHPLQENLLKKRRGKSGIGTSLGDAQPFATSMTGGEMKKGSFRRVRRAIHWGEFDDCSIDLFFRKKQKKDKIFFNKDFHFRLEKETT